jgi:hypothetical protein
LRTLTRVITTYAVVKKSTYVTTLLQNYCRHYRVISEIKKRKFYKVCSKARP